MLVRGHFSAGTLNLFPQPQYILHVVKAVGLVDYPEGSADSAASEVVAAVSAVCNL
jgi:hypothetical protein